MFYNTGIFLTMFIDVITANKSIEVDNANLKSRDLRWWNEHIILTFDYHKALALNDVPTYKKIKDKLCILETPPNLDKMFEIYDNLFNKDLYKVLNSIVH